MKIMALLTMAAGADRTAFGPLLVPEEQALWAAYREGILREWYFQPEPLAVTLIYEAANVTAVEHQIDALPMVQAGLLDLRIVTLGPWLPLEVMFDASLKPSVPTELG